MKLTNTRNRTLSTYQRLHGTQPTMLSPLAPVWWRYLLVIALASIAILVLPAALTFLGAGIILGMVIRDLRRYRDLAQMWPMYETILE